MPISDDVVIAGLHRYTTDAAVQLTERKGRVVGSIEDLDEITFGQVECGPFQPDGLAWAFGTQNQGPILSWAVASSGIPTRIVQGSTAGRSESIDDRDLCVRCSNKAEHEQSREQGTHARGGSW